MGTAPGQSTPGTQSVPGQTADVEPGDAGRAGRGDAPEHLQGLLDHFPEASVPDWRFADGLPTAAVARGAPADVLAWLRDKSAPRFDLLVDCRRRPLADARAAVRGHYLFTRSRRTRASG